MTNEPTLEPSLHPRSAESVRRAPRTILSRIERFSVRTERETLEIHRLGVFDTGTVELVELNAGQYYPPHIHARSAARLQVIVGSGVILLDGAPHAFRAGCVFEVPPGMSHGFRVTDQTVLLSTQDRPILDAATGVADVTYVEQG